MLMEIRSLCNTIVNINIEDLPFTFNFKKPFKIFEIKRLCRCSHDIMLLHQDLYIPADTKMVKAGYQYDNCGHSEVMENVFKIAHTCFFR